MHGQHRIAQVDIVERQTPCFAEAKTGAVEKQKQCSQGIGIELDRSLPADIDGAEQALQLVTRVDVRWCRPWLSGLTIGRRERRAGRVSTADGVAVEPGQGAVLVGAVSGERTVAGKEAENVRFADGFAADVPADMLAEAMQQSRAGDEPRAVGLAPGNIGVDCVAENHAKPSRSMSATSRRTLRWTLAYTAVAETLRCPR